MKPEDYLGTDQEMVYDTTIAYTPEATFKPGAEGYEIKAAFTTGSQIVIIMQRPRLIKRRASVSVESRFTITPNDDFTRMP